MNFIFSELKVLKDQQASDFQATMLAFGTTRSTTQGLARDVAGLARNVEALARNVEALTGNVEALTGNLDSVQGALQAQHATSEARLDKLEEAVHLLQGSRIAPEAS